MSGEIFVDAGAWLALADKRDKFHDVAKSSYPKIIHDWTMRVTTNLVVSESYALIRSRLGHRAAIAYLDNINSSTPQLVLKRLIPTRSWKNWQKRSCFDMTIKILATLMPSVSS